MDVNKTNLNSIRLNYLSILDLDILCKCCEVRSLALFAVMPNRMQLNIKISSEKYCCNIHNAASRCKNYDKQFCWRCIHQICVRPLAVMCQNIARAIMHFKWQMPATKSFWRKNKNKIEMPNEAHTTCNISRTIPNYKFKPQIFYAIKKLLVFISVSFCGFSFLAHFIWQADARLSDKMCQHFKQLFFVLHKLALALSSTAAIMCSVGICCMQHKIQTKAKFMTSIRCYVSGPAHVCKWPKSKKKFARCLSESVLGKNCANYWWTFGIEFCCFAHWPSFG